jgi:hypothetical protein
VARFVSQPVLPAMQWAKPAMHVQLQTPLVHISDEALSVLQSPGTQQLLDGTQVPLFAQ